MKHVGIEIKFYNLDTFKKQIDVNFIDLDSELVDLNYKVASLIFCHFWRSILVDSTYNCKTQQNANLTGQERQGYVQLKVSWLFFCYILTYGLFYLMGLSTTHPTLSM